MRTWLYVGVGIWLLISYYLLNWAFWLTLFFFIIYILYVIYRWIERLMTPKGHRIKHGMLRGHLQSEYGTREGGKLYKEIVSELRRKGYR